MAAMMAFFHYINRWGAFALLPIVVILTARCIADFSDANRSTLGCYVLAWAFCATEATRKKK